MTSALDILQAGRQAAEQRRADSDARRAYLEIKRAEGWTAADIAEYKAEVDRIFTEGSEDEKQAARDFWRLKIQEQPGYGVNRRIRDSIAAERANAQEREAA